MITSCIYSYFYKFFKIILLILFFVFLFVCFLFSVISYGCNLFADINMFTIELSIKDENVHIAYLLFNTIGSIFPQNKCLLEIIMLTQDLDIR